METEGGNKVWTIQRIWVHISKDEDIHNKKHNTENQKGVQRTLPSKQKDKQQTKQNGHHRDIGNIGYIKQVIKTGKGTK